MSKYSLRPECDITFTDDSDAVGTHVPLEDGNSAI